MGGNPFKQIGKAVGGIFKGATNLVGGVLGLKDEKVVADIPEPPAPVKQYDAGTEGGDNAIRKNRRRSSFAGTQVASRLGLGSGVQGKSFLGQ